MSSTVPDNHAGEILNAHQARRISSEAALLAARDRLAAVNEAIEELDNDPECDIDFCRECGDEYTDPCPRHRPHCECDSHTGLGEDLWQCDECGEVIRYVDDPTGTVTLTTLVPRSDRRVRIEMVTPGSRPGDRRWWS